MILIYAQSEVLREHSVGCVPFELVVSHVSTLWRDIVIGTPSMWATIFIHQFQSYQWIKLHIRRSKAYPLDVFVDHGVQSYAAGPTVSDTCLNTIVLNVDRLRYLQVVGPINDIYTTLSHFKSHAAPLLQEVVLRGQGLDWSWSNGVPQVFTGGTPLLSSLQLDGIGPRTCLVPLSAITNMSLCDISDSGLWKYEQFYAVLGSAPALAELSIHGLIVDHWGAHGNPPVYLPSLRSLWLSGKNTHVSYILLSLSTPQIEFLSLNGLTPFNYHFVFQSNSATDAPKYSTVSSLVFTRTVPLRQFSSLFPSLTNLTILHCNPHSALQELVDVQLSPCAPCSALETLTIFPLFYSGGYDGALVQFLYELVNMRIKQGCPLYRLRLDNKSWSLLLPETVEMLSGQVEVEVLTQAPTYPKMI
jgi:hypothetical protein